MPSVAVDTVHFLLNTLLNADVESRASARSLLVAIGRPAVIPLIDALEHEEEQVRWDAAWVLGQIRDHSAAPALVQVLDDESFGVRCLAVVSLATMGRPALAPLLQAMAGFPGPAWMSSAQHVLRLLAEKGLRELVAPVLAALSGPDPAVEVPLAARLVLAALEGSTSSAREDRPPYSVSYLVRRTVQ